MKGSDVKDLAVGIAILAGVAGVVYLWNKGSKAIDQATDATKKGVGYVFGIDSLNPNSSIGTDFYNAIHGSPSQTIDEAQAVKTCNALWASGGKVPQGSVCQTLYAQGKLTAPHSALSPASDLAINNKMLAPTDASGQLQFDP